MAKRSKSIARTAARRTDVVVCGQRMEAAYSVPALQPEANGQWRVEPDKIAWTDHRTGYPCIIRREEKGHLGAYVGVARGHPLFGYEADAVPTGLLSASGGIDYAAPCDQHGNESQSICHVRGGARHDDLWWLGTVCNRIGDLIPDDMAHAREAQRLGITQTYRDAETLFRVCTDLAAELKILEDER